MQIPRLQLFELEDQPWFPAPVRDLATDYLRFMQTRFELHHPAAALLGEAVRATASERVVDLCSGGGGPVPALSRSLAAEGLEVDYVLTDRFPNGKAFRRIVDEHPSSISFVAEPVDARAVPAQLTGFRTLFNAFHHFAPDDARAVLRDAARSGQPIGVFEIPDRALPMILSMLLLTPWLVLLATPCIRPFTWARFLCTYMVPLVPLTCWWDGVVSQLRAYTPAELERLAESVGVESYRWRAGKVALSSGPGSLTYLIGYPGGIDSDGPVLRRGVA
jgi:hypothetical protein